MRALAALLLLATVPAQAASLTVKTGETWAFILRNGHPIGAHKVEPSAKPRPARSSSRSARLWERRWS